MDKNSQHWVFLNSLLLLCAMPLSGKYNHSPSHTSCKGPRSKRWDLKQVNMELSTWGQLKASNSPRPPLHRPARELSSGCLGLCLPDASLSSSTQASIHLMQDSGKSSACKGTCHPWPDTARLTNLC